MVSQFLLGCSVEQAGEVAFQGCGPLAAGEVDVEGCEELGQFRQRGAGGVWDSGTLHTRSTLQADPKVQVTKQY